jgi:hypothetical protein
MIFNRKQIRTTLFIAGPFASALLLAKNFRNSGKKSNTIEIAGFLLTAIMYIIALIIIENTIAKRGLLDDHDGLMNVYAIGIFILVQLFTALGLFPLLRAPFLKDYSCKDSEVFRNAKTIPYVITGIGLTFLLIMFGPFRFFFLMVYMIPHYYIYKRVSMAYISSNAKRVIASLLLLFMLLFPVVEMMYGFYNNGIVRFGLVISYFYLPFILYFFMGLVLYDLVIMSLTTFRLVNKSFYSPQKWRTALGVISAMALIIVTYAHIHFNSPSYTNYNIEISSENQGLKNVKVAMASDFHFAEISYISFVKRFVQKVNQLKPDIVLLPGDIVESDKENEKMDRIAHELTKLEATYGVFGSLGNHEYYGDLEKNIQFCEKAGIGMLMDTAIVIENAFVLAGQNDMHDENRKSLSAILQDVPENLPVILMRHRPVQFDEVVNENITLMVSGHTHHGQLFPFQLMTKAFYDLSWGHKTIRDTHFITTSGAQGWGPQARTTGKSEIAVIDMIFNAAK